MQTDTGRSRPSRTLLYAFAVPVVAIVAVIGTRAIAGPADSSSSTPSKPNAVVIKNFAFSPDHPTVAKGTTIVVTNDDGTAHTFSAKDGSFNTGDLGGGTSKKVTLNQAGTFDFYCKIHTYMTGTLVVK